MDATLAREDCTKLETDLAMERRLYRDKISDLQNEKLKLERIKVERDRLDDRLIVSYPTLIHDTVSCEPYSKLKRS